MKSKGLLLVALKSENWWNQTTASTDYICQVPFQLDQIFRQSTFKSTRSSAELRGHIKIFVAPGGFDPPTSP